MARSNLVAVFDHPEKNLKGNTAAVIFLDQAISAERMQSIAFDLNQPATSFLWPSDKPSHYHVRWFAPDGEIGLCGHGTLAAVACMKESVTLLAGEYHLTGKKLTASQAEMDLDAISVLQETHPPQGLEEALGVSVKGYFKTENKDIVLLENESMVKEMILLPYAKLTSLDMR